MIETILIFAVTVGIAEANHKLNEHLRSKTYD